MNDLIKIANKELLDTYNKIKPTEQDFQSRLDWYKFIEKKILKLYPETKLTLFGSFYTGLFTKSSDIDISIGINTNNPNLILRNIKNELYKSKMIYNLIHLSHAKIPILKFKIKKLGFKFDISINNESGVLAAIFVKNIVKENEHLKIFAILFKHFITSRKLGDASVGGLNSYSQYLMIYNYFLMHPIINSLCIQTNLSVLFFDFIQFYGYTFKYKSVQIDCKNVVYKPNINKRLSIIDPTDSSIDVGACCKNMDVVIDSLQNFYRTILYHFENNSVEFIFKDLFDINKNIEIEIDKFVTKKPKKIKSRNLRDINLYKNVVEEKSDISNEKKVKSNKKGKKEKIINKDIKVNYVLTEQNSAFDKSDNEKNFNLTVKKTISVKKDKLIDTNKLLDKKDKFAKSKNRKKNKKDKLDKNELYDENIRKENMKKRYIKIKSDTIFINDKSNTQNKKIRNTQIYDNFVSDLKCESTLIEEDIKHKKKKIKKDKK